MEKSDIELKQPLAGGPAVPPNPTTIQPLQPYTQKQPHINEQRPTWSNPLENLCAVLSYVIGYGSVWRFPYLMYRSGGIVFLIAYVIMLLVIGFPLLLLESYLGQFTSNGVLTCWEMFPLFKGVGVAIMFLCATTTAYYAVINAWAVNYFFYSWRTTLPWASCDNAWNTPNCDNGNNINEPNGYSVDDNYNNDYNYVSNATYYFGSDQKVMPAGEFWFYKVLNVSDGIDSLGTPIWQIALALLSTWVIICAVLAFGPKVYGKIAYVTLMLPVPLLFILLIRACTLPGATEGLKYLFYPDWSQLAGPYLWTSAANQVIFSLGVGFGPIITLSSYSKFRNDCVRDIFFVPVVHLVFSIVCSIFVLGIVGYVAFYKGLPIQEVMASGPELAFNLMPTAFASMPVAPFWSSLFYFMLIIIGLGSMFALAETIVTGVLDLGHTIQRYRPIVVLGVCVICFLLGLPFTTRGGIYIFHLVDMALWQELILIFLAVLYCVVAMYGLFSHVLTNASLLRFKDDLRLMLGGKGCHFVPWVICWPVWSIMWAFVTPAVLVVVRSYNKGTIFFDHRIHILGSSYEFPQWANALLLFIAEIPIWLMVITPGVILMLRCCCCCRGNKLSDALEYLIKPTRFWGPALPKYRQRMNKYVPENKFEFDPWNTPEYMPSQGSLA